MTRVNAVTAAAHRVSAATFGAFTATLIVALLALGAVPAWATPVSGRYEATYDPPVDKGNESQSSSINRAVAVVKDLKGCNDPGTPGQITPPIAFRVNPTRTRAAFVARQIELEDANAASDSNGRVTDPNARVFIDLLDDAGSTGDDVTIEGPDKDGFAKFERQIDLEPGGTLQLEGGQSAELLGGTVFIVGSFFDLPLRSGGQCPAGVESAESVFGSMGLVLRLSGATPEAPARIFVSGGLPFGGYSCTEADCSAQNTFAEVAQGASAVTRGASAAASPSTPLRVRAARAAGAQRRAQR